ncbi:MAG: sigma-54-dependent Fis family transcriptional regulator [Bacteroidetes bacterium]|jgi:two-component system, NtrC family, nitrogen regulation response regulator NtrX|nr:sigma-54-dependent Fis family transcriptional regulator [Bacteroidota bacterium]MBT3934593.1 sigma-54-dependent Fis family transcriptional regulator [Bacteroidota bacterium]MBT4338861.1 sigma-54-dependent Fis family transcriptional regulator [Bacteroidota bacterium]MBT4727369.1 sigma-54-dependent Fis family transcriptional regulator [Bacteroidota bacterium]MBT5989849.1 sigma-54-dependent Fis family transcriptional regulator [Bacteroidota bacterium]
MPEILIVDDEKVIRETLKDILEYEKYKIEEAADGLQAIEKIKKKKYDAVLCDIKMPKMDGIEVLEQSMAINPDVPFIMISGHGTVEIAVEATRKGAFAFISKPPDLNQLLLHIRNAIDRTELVKETKVLKRKISKTHDIIGESKSITDIRDTIDKVAETEARILITGKNGTGKELVARWIHEKSNRNTGALVEVNCAAIPSELIESELFGHEKGSFTSAHKQRIGKFEQANDGTLFLDEIGDMSLSAQAKVLRALQEKVIVRVGGEKHITVNPRVIAATNKDLLKEIEKGNFREDLYHRLSVIVMRVPSLNERENDIALLADRFIKEICQEHGLPMKTFHPDALQELKKITWTGNVRELHNAIERMAILCEKEITAEDVRLYGKPIPRHDISKELDISQFKKMEEFKEQAEMIFLREKLNLYNWDIDKAATEIGISVKATNNLIDKYNIKK